MRIRNFVFGLLLTTMIVLSVAAQQISEDPPKVVIVPRTYALPVVVYQPDCPILLEKYSVMSLPEGGSASAVYSFKNTGAKPIQSYSIAWLTTSGTGGEGTFTAKTPTEQIQPGERIPTDKGRSVLVPLTEDIRKALKFDEPMIGLFILIVVRIEYADGTVFSDEPTYKALKAYLEKLGGKKQVVVGVPEELVELQARFETWGAGRKYIREPMPDELRNAARATRISSNIITAKSALQTTKFVL